MRQLFNFIRKEFYHVLRDRKTLLMLFGVPVAQIVLFGFALTNETKNSKIVIVDYAHDQASQQLIDKIQSSHYFRVEKTLMDQKDIEAAFKSGRTKLALVIPLNFEQDLSHLNKAAVQVIADASDPNTATTLTNYVTAIIADFQAGWLKIAAVPYRIVPEVRMLYNPNLKGAPNFVPGVMAMVLLLVCVMMTSVSVVREKEMGTMEVLLVSPFRPILVIVAKMIPYLFVSLLNLVIILLLSVYLLDMPVRGSILLLVLESTMFIITGLTLGLLVSTITSTQESAMSTSMLMMMLPTMMLSGYIYPIENMPLPLQWLSNIVPARWYYIIIKSIMLKGLGVSYIWKETLILGSMTVFFMIISLRNFKIRLE
ncbi:MAG: ABC transporter permease [Bacteroidia bacterium]